MWEIWLIALILFLIIMIWTSHTLFFTLSASSLMTLFYSLVSHALYAHFLLFIIASTFFYILFKFLPIHLPYYHTKSIHLLIGKQGIVTKAIGTSFLSGGTIKLDGETWCALSANQKSISIGETVRVKNISGLHVIVTREK